MLVRPVTMKDHAELLELAKKAGIGMLSLPPDPAVLEEKIHLSERSFGGHPELPKEESFLFVLEDTSTRKLVGTTGIVAHVGLSWPFYSYKISTIVQANSELDIYSTQQVLHMVNDYTGVTELCSLFLLPDYRRDGIGRFLSRCRYLMLAEFPDLFSDKVIAEIRGVNDDRGGAPFYDHLAGHFCKMTFAQADYICATRGNQFIADLMPKYPIYVNLLPAEAQAVIGKPLPASAPAMQLLLREGFSYEGYIDVLDAGPTVQAERKRIRGVAASRKGAVGKLVDAIASENQKFMICNSTLGDFRMVVDGADITPEGQFAITKSAAAKLQVGVGDAIRISPT